MREYGLYIDGEFVEPLKGESMVSVNPFNQEPVARVGRAGIEDTRRATAAARRAFDEGPWSRMSGEERRAYMLEISKGIKAHFEELLRLEVQDTGSTIRKAEADVKMSIKKWNYFADLALLDPVDLREDPSRSGFSRNLVVYEPVGVCAQIIPWNFALMMAVEKIAYALPAGNTVVLKPAPDSAVTAMELAQIIHTSGLPPGVVNIIPGFGPDVGEELATNPMVDKVGFTGSTAVGRRVMSLASSTLKRLTLECGGKSANIVLEDADLDMAIDGSIFAAFFHAGQVCHAGTRLFLPESLLDEFVERMQQRVQTIRLGDPMDPLTDMGPLIAKRQQERVLGYIDQGKQAGARLVCGGGVPQEAALSRGFFVQPTIFTEVDNRMAIAQEEIFGPVLAVLSYRTVDEAVALANETIYGLGGAIWSRDEEKALALARRLRTGTVWINEYGVVNRNTPFGGFKQSGIGREFGIEGMREYTEPKHVHVDLIGRREPKTWYDLVIRR